MAWPRGTRARARYGARLAVGLGRRVALCALYPGRVIPSICQPGPLHLLLIITVSPTQRVVTMAVPVPVTVTVTVTVSMTITISVSVTLTLTTTGPRTTLTDYRKCERTSSLNPNGNRAPELGPALIPNNTCADHCTPARPVPVPISALLIKPDLSPWPDP